MVYIFGGIGAGAAFAAWAGALLERAGACADRFCAGCAGAEDSARAEDSAGAEDEFGLAAVLEAAEALPCFLPHPERSRPAARAVIASRPAFHWMGRRMAEPEAIFEDRSCFSTWESTVTVSLDAMWILT